MDWTAGYASDVEYTAGFYREQSPSYLNFVCLLNGFEPVPLHHSFTYFELGFGRGLTVNLQAASNPQGRFYAADFNPAHVCGARQLAEAAQLGNVTLLENSFADLAEGKVVDLPKFDFITLHGIYTWVTAENRQHIVRFIDRYLKPGGIVFLSYNALPGWAVAQPLQRLLVEHASLYPNRSDMQIEQAKKFVERLNELQAAYFFQNPILASRLETLKNGNNNYLVHEYMHRHWQPLYHADVARDLAGAKLDYAGSADLPLAFPALYLTPEKQELINGLPDSSLRETMRDYLLNTAFRKDVFVRGARSMTTVRHADCMQKVGLALIVPREKVTLKMKLPFGDVNAKEDMYIPVLDALAKRPHSLVELVELHAIKGQTLNGIVQIAAILTASGQAAPYFVDNGPVAAEPAQAMNRALAAQARYSDDLQAFASPLLGNGIGAALVDRLVYLVLSQQPREIDAASVTQQVAAIMAEQGRRMLKDGKTLDSDEENMAELLTAVTHILTQKLPIWRHLKMF